MTPPRSHDDERLLAQLDGALRPRAEAPTPSELDALRDALEDRRLGVAPAEVVPLRPPRAGRPTRRLVLAAAAVFVAIVVAGAVLVRAARDEPTVVADQPTVPVDRAVERADVALDELRLALRGDDVATIASAAASAQARLDRLDAEQRATFEPGAGRLLQRAEVRVAELTTTTSTPPGTTPDATTPPATADDDGGDGDNSGPGSGGDSGGDDDSGGGGPGEDRSGSNSGSG